MKLFVSALPFLCTVSCARRGGSRLPAPLKFLKDKLIEFRKGVRDEKKLKKTLKDKIPRMFASKDNQDYEIITDYSCLQDENLKEELDNGPVKLSVEDFKDRRKLGKGAEFISKRYFEHHIDEWKWVIKILKNGDHSLYEKEGDEWIYADSKMIKKGGEKLRLKYLGFKDVEGNDAELTFDTPKTKSEGDEQGDEQGLEDIILDKTPRTFASKDNQGYEIVTDYSCLQDKTRKDELDNGPVELSVEDFKDRRNLGKGAKFVSKQYYEDHIDDWNMVYQCLSKDDGITKYHQNENKEWLSSEWSSSIDLDNNGGLDNTKFKRHSGKLNFKDVEGNGAELTFDTPETKSEGDEQGAKQGDKQSTAGSGEQPGQFMVGRVSPTDEESAKEKRAFRAKEERAMLKEKRAMLKDILLDNCPRTLATKGSVYEIITDYSCLQDKTLKEELDKGHVKLRVKDFNDGRKVLKGVKFVSKQYYENHIDDWNMVYQCLKEDDGITKYHQNENKEWSSSIGWDNTKFKRHSGKLHFKDVEGNGAELTFDT